MLNHVGPYTLDRPSTPGFSRTLRLRVEQGGGIINGPQPPKLKHGWKCFFIGRTPNYTTFSYKKVTA